MRLPRRIKKEMTSNDILELRRSEQNAAEQSDGRRLRAAR
jgi:hypothetical protein